MARVVGIGGIFVRARDPFALRAWYQEHLGFPSGSDAFAGVTFPVSADDVGQYAVWSAFKSDTDYFGARTQSYMVNLRVDDLEGLLAKLAEAGIEEVGTRETLEGLGHFAWIMDPEGNKLELWQPA